jgi:hypothetical protein
MNIGKKYLPVKEIRNWYFVEYSPPINDFKFANLQLVMTSENISDADVADAMEEELKHWLNRFPVPLIVSAFDNTGSLYNLKEIKGYNHLIRFFDHNQIIRMYWRLVRDAEIPNVALNKEYLDNIYAGLDYETYAELDAKRRQKISAIKRGSFLLFLWLVVVPALIAILEYYSNLLSLVAMIYSLYMAIKTGLGLRGKLPKSKKQKAKEKEERLKDHYYYHCQKNPEGFKKLMLENLEQMSRSEIAKEAAALRKHQQKSKRYTNRTSPQKS